ncbi:hypothetical protein HMPREF0262_01712 [Clostridium sp. ATCC 29733]|nr:hypothetical protein HMPREF0262_01712 [Clostridium sp. ATCC 29733]
MGGLSVQVEKRRRCWCTSSSDKTVEYLRLEMGLYCLIFSISAYLRQS